MVTLTKAKVQTFYSQNRNDISDIILLQGFLNIKKVKDTLIASYTNITAENYNTQVGGLIQGMIDDLLTPISDI